MNNKNAQGIKAPSSGKSNVSTFNVKSKKAAKDREKRRSVVNVDKNEVHTHNNTEKGSPSKVGIIK